MKLRTLALAAASLVVLGLAVPAVAGSSLPIGDRVPSADVKMKNVDGNEVSIGQVMGEKGAVVIFMCNACPWAKAWEERIVKLGNIFVAQGVGVIAVNSNDPAEYPDDGYETMQARAKQRGMLFPYVVDATSGVAKSFGATRTPEAFVFDKDGKLVYHGTIDDNAKEPEKVQATYLKDALESVVAGKDVAVKETKALGCGIKFRS